MSTTHVPLSLLLVSRPRCRWAVTVNVSTSVKKSPSPPTSPSPCRWTGSPASWRRLSSASTCGTRPTWCRRPRGGSPCPISTSKRSSLSYRGLMNWVKTTNDSLFTTEQSVNLISQTQSECEMNRFGLSLLMLTRSNWNLDAVCVLRLHHQHRYRFMTVAVLHITLIMSFPLNYSKHLLSHWLWLRV